MVGERDASPPSRPDDSQLHDPHGKPTGQLPDTPLPERIPRYTEDQPVIFGHYWRSGAPAIESRKTACVDYSAGMGGPLVAYRWSGESELSNANLVAC